MPRALTPYQHAKYHARNPWPEMVGKTISHYRIVAKLGAGGMGVVYHAHDEQLDRAVALKVLTPGTLADEASRRRFRREALALAKLNHPNIESVYEFASENGIDFLVMELVTGITLHTKLAAGPVPEKEVLRLGAQLADGLKAAHAQGIIHRDLKPGNLHITKDGRLKILDFGLAQWNVPSDGSSLALTLTKSQEITGTLPYMAPEQLRGHRADQRTDIYSAGAVLYEMVTAKRPYDQTSAPQLISAILERPLQPPSAHGRQISPLLESIIVKALDKDPNRRYQSARELHIDLDRLTTGVAPVVRGSHRGQRWKVAVVALIVIFTAVLMSVPGVRSRLFNPAKPAPAINKARRSVAVLGFKNLSGKPEHAWISTALAELLSTELGAGEQIRTIPGENVARTKHDLELEDADSFGRESLGKIRAHLGTDLIVVGSYLDMGSAAGAKLRLDLRLQDAVAGETIASISETGTENDLLELISQSGAKLRQKIGVGQVTASDASDVRASLPGNTEAARLYSDGLAKLRVLDALAARDLLERAVKADPTHAPSHVALAEAWSALGYDARAAAEGLQASRLSQSASREERLFVEARSNELAHRWPKAIEIYRSLTAFFPDNLEYGLRLAASQTAAGAGKDTLGTIEQLRALPPPMGEDARIDLAESRAAAAISDLKRSEAAAGSALVKGRAQGMQLVVAQARSAQGWALERLGESRESAIALTEAQDLFKAAGDKMGAALALLLSGHVLYDKGDFNGALQTYQESLDVFHTLGNKQREASALNSVGNVYYDQGNLTRAKEYYEKSVAIYREIEDKSGLAGGLGNLANVFDSMGNLQEALKMQQAGLDAFREVGDQRGAASTLGNLGNLLLEMGDLDGAEARYTEALQLDTQIGYRRGQGYIIYGLADVLTQRGDLVRARERSEEAVGIRRGMGEQLNVALSQAQLANIELEEERYAEAQGLIRAAMTQFVKEKLFDSQASADALLSHILLIMGQADEARKLADEAVELAQRSATRPARFDAELARARTFGYLGYEYQTCLALGETEIRSGKTKCRPSAACDAWTRGHPKGLCLSRARQKNWQLSLNCVIPRRQRGLNGAPC